MKSELRGKIAGAFAVVAMLFSSGAVFAASGMFEEVVDVSGTAVIHVSNETGAVRIIGDDVDQVTIRAWIDINKRLSRSDPKRAGQIIRSVKRSPPVSVDGDRIEINKIQGRYQRHASVSYEIVVPRNSEINVHSVSGNVNVTGVNGVVNATSETGEVTLAESS